MYCLKETAVPIESAFSIEFSEGEALSVMIQLKHLKLLGVIKESEAWFKKIREGIAFNKACTKFYPYRSI